MKKYALYICSLLLLISGTILTSCSDDAKIVGDAPQVLFPFESLSVDMNKATKPLLISVVNSEVGLQSISVYITKSGGAEDLFEAPTTTFKNKNSHSMNLVPIYTEDMQSFRVVAVDLNGQQSIGEVPLHIIPLRDPPVVKFYNGTTHIEELVYEEGKPLPAFNIKVTSEEGLNAVTLVEIKNRETFELHKKEDFEENIKSYDYNLADIPYIMDLTTTSLKVSVSAGPIDNPKLKVATLPIKVILKPKAEITFDNKDEVMEIVELQPIKLTGKIEAVSKTDNITFLKRLADGSLVEFAGKTISLPEPVEVYNFNFELASATDDIKGIVVMTVDQLNKEASEEKVIFIKELIPKPTITLNQTAADFNGLDKDSQLTLSGTITTLGQLASVKTIARYMDDTEVEDVIPITAANEQTLNLNSIITAKANLASVRVEAVDIAGKKSVTETMNTYVGYRFYRAKVSGSGNGTVAGVIPFFSAALGTGLSYCDGKDNRTLVNVGFCTYTSSTQMRVGNTRAFNSGKFKDNITNCGIASWIEPNAINVLLKEASGITRSNFDIATIDMLQAEAAAPISPLNKDFNLTTGAISNAPNNIADIAVFYQTVINGVSKRVVLCLDEFETPIGNPDAAKFWIKVKVEK